MTRKTDCNNHCHSYHRLHPRHHRPSMQLGLVLYRLGSGLAWLWRVQNRRECPGPMQQPSRDLDWRLLLSLIAGDKRTKIDNYHVLSLVGGLHVQCSNGTCFSRVSFEQLLPRFVNGWVPHLNGVTFLSVMLFVAILPIFYVIFHMTPSNCGPFVGQRQFYSVVTDFYYNDIPGKWFVILTWI